MQQELLSPEVQKVMERLFIFSDSSDLEFNQQIGLVVNPEILKILLALPIVDQSHKLQILQHVSEVFQQSQLNSYILSRRDSEIMEFNCSILLDIFDLILTLKLQPDEVQGVISLLDPFLRGYVISCRHVRHLTSKLAEEFFYQRLNPMTLQLSIQILMRILRHQIHSNKPHCFFLMTGLGSGIKMALEGVKWSFSKGFYVDVQFFIDHVMNEDMQLLHIAVAQDTFSVEIDRNGNFGVKVFNVVKKLHISSLQLQVWHRARIAYTLKTGIISNTYELKVYLDDDPFEFRNLPILSAGMRDRVEELSIGVNMLGRISALAMSREPLHSWPEEGINNWPMLEGYLERNRKNLKHMFLLYTPIVGTSLRDSSYAYDIINGNHGQLQENTFSFINPFTQVSINYYGGFYTLLPLLHILKFYRHGAYPEALTDIGRLYLMLFEEKYHQVQTQAINCQFCSVCSLLINELEPQLITEHAMLAFGRIGFTLQNERLRRDFLLNFLWKLKISRTSVQTAKAFFVTIERYYIENFNESYSLFSLCDIIGYIVSHYQPGSADSCCAMHWLTNYKEDQSEPADLLEISTQYSEKFDGLAGLLKLVVGRISGDHNFVLGKEPEIMNYLLHNSSSCLKLNLLVVLAHGSSINPKLFYEGFKLLPYLFALMEQKLIKEALPYIVNLLKVCCQVANDSHLQLQIVNKLAVLFENIQLQELEVTSKRARRPLTCRRHPVYTRSNSADSYEDSDSNEKKQIKGRVLEAMKQKQLVVKTDEALFREIVDFCFHQAESVSDCRLRSDIYMRVVQPYFKVCCFKFKVNLINMIQKNVLVSQRLIEMNPVLGFNHVYKFLLSEFILRELEPESPEYRPNQYSKHITTVVFSLIDFTVLGAEHDWKRVYIYLLRLIALLDEAKADLVCKYHYPEEVVHRTTKRCVRKFLLQVLKIGQASRQNLPNLIFLVCLVVFNNPARIQEQKLFLYFNQLEKHLYIDNLQILPDSTFQTIHKPSFVDCKVILQIVSALRLKPLDEASLKMSSFIESYLQSPTAPEALVKARDIYLSFANFKSLAPGEKGIRLFIQNFISREDTTSKNICVAEIVSLLLGLCVQACIYGDSQELLHQTLSHYVHFFKSFVLVCSRDGLGNSQKQARDKQLPKNVSYQLIHILYSLMDSSAGQKHKKSLEASLYQMVAFLGLLVDELNQRLGGPQLYEEALLISEINPQVQHLNYFSYEIAPMALTLTQIKHFPHAARQKALNLLRLPQFRSCFVQPAQPQLQKQILEVANTHSLNIALTVEDVREAFKRTNISQYSVLSGTSLYSEISFEKQFVIPRLKFANLHYRNTKRIWRKIWKRLRLYHYYWSFSMNQRGPDEGSNPKAEEKYSKHSKSVYHHKFSKFVDVNGVRSILEVEPSEPWHVKKVMMDKEIQYRQSTQMFNLFKADKLEKKPRSLLEKVFLKSSNSTGVFGVEWIKHNSKRKGLLTVQQEKLKFTYESIYQKDSHIDFTSFTLAEYKSLEKYWDLIGIVDIIQRRYLTKKECLLIEFEDGTSLIFYFVNEDTSEFIRMIEAKQAERYDKQPFFRANNIGFFTKKFTFGNISEKLDQTVNKWRDYKLNNLQYLMAINKLAGRSYLDPVHYPVMPWIIGSYQGSEIVHRDLSRTLAGLGSKSRRDFFIAKKDVVDPFNTVPFYQFGTHYSSPGMIFNFLVRLTPYTEAARTLQGDRFDLSDRLFSSIKSCWASVTHQVSDVRELLPEFFYMPELFLNVNNYDFGVTQAKVRVNHVQMPDWAPTPYQFIARQRLELEGPYVSQNINNWIDLIFGFKQKGPIAEQNFNLYYYLTYENSINLEKITDEIERISIEAQIIHFGQTPSQIFTRPHPIRTKIMTEGKSPTIDRVNLLGSIQCNNEPIIIGAPSSDRLLLFVNYELVVVRCNGAMAEESRIKLTKTNKDALIYLEDINYRGLVRAFKDCAFVAVAAYVNGNLAIYSVADGIRIQEKSSCPKTCIYINESENLLLCGGKNGLFEVYEIVYGQKGTVALIKICEEYFLAPIEQITETSQFYVICAGNYAIIYRINRGMAYVYDKKRQKGASLVRSFCLGKKILGAFIVMDPLCCLVAYNALEVYIYSINGQLLKKEMLDIKLPPLKGKDHLQMDILYILREKALEIYSLPDLILVRRIPVPSAIEFTSMRLVEDKCYLTAHNGEIFCVSKNG